MIFRLNLAMENERNSIIVSNGHHVCAIHLNRKKWKKKNKENNFIPFVPFRQHPGKSQKELQDG